MRLIISCCWILFILIIYQESICKKGSEPSIAFDRDTVLNNTVEIPEDVTCVIKAGITIRFSGYYRFIVNGLLIAEGTKENPILITGVDRPRGSTEPPCWQGFEIRGEKADAVFKYCRIEGAYRNFFYDTRPTIKHCEFVGNHCAIYCSNKAAAYVKNCKIYRNKYGIVADFASPMILDNVIAENVVGVLMMRSSRLIAGRNVVAKNKKDIHSEESFGENYDAISLKYIWDLMSQLY